jgi:hypothetical protein
MQEWGGKQRLSENRLTEGLKVEQAEFVEELPATHRHACKRLVHRTVAMGRPRRSQRLGAISVG